MPWPGPRATAPAPCRSWPNWPGQPPPACGWTPGCLVAADREQGIAALLQLLDGTPEAPRAWAGRIERALAS
ncbi:hypothetical protein DPM13_02555 [Paracoccus mutanolyticus]|uniref:Uncharacterized protein n=1 Tax=Paracoccus mutanolyticus TaxID=1499308 RepID=A0ABM6WPH8_9RHOB|nr:hypothetical protein [Paracoccus mutanolyticus]AWX92487.1 hypothetical protein DPM13_02555 [Paracoccus mutanolyticus]